MGRDFRFYFIIAAVVVTSVALSTYPNLPESTRLLLSLPTISGLSAIIVQAWRDQRLHERAKELQQNQNQVTLGIASDMARIAFEQHVEFAKAYAEKLHQTIAKLANEGPKVPLHDELKALKDLRIKYAIWLTSDIELKLLPFEKALRSIGINATIAEAYDRPGHERTIFIEAMFEELRRVVQIQDGDKVQTGDEAAISVIAHLRKVLSISELTTLRQNILEQASKTINTK